MVFSRRTVLLVVLSLVLLSIVLRYPLVEHERLQTDSYFMHQLAGSIVDEHRARWTLNPLSYFGYYPFSYPSGVPFIIAEFSVLTGLALEPSILLIDYMMATLFCLGVFLLARQFLARPNQILLATFFAVVASRFVDTTYWDGSARGPLVVIVMLCVLIAFRASSSGRPWLNGVTLFLGFGCFMIHHMAVMLVLFGFGYLVSSSLSRFLLPKLQRSYRARFAAFFTSSIAALVFIVSYIIFDYFKKLTFMNLQRTNLFNLDSPLLSVILNMAGSYTNQIGVILIPAMIGIVAVYRASRNTTERFFLVALLIAFIPLLGNALYTSMILTPFVAFLGTWWITRTYDRSRRKRYIAIAVMLVMATSLFLPFWSSDRWNENQYLSGDTVKVDSGLYNDANYLNVYYPTQYSISNVKATMVVLSATSETHFLAAGIPSLLNGDVSSKDVRHNVTRSDADFPNNLFLWLESPQEIVVDNYLYSLMLRGSIGISGPGSHASLRDYFETHSRLMVVIDNDWPNSYIDVYSVIPAAFLDEVRNSYWKSGYTEGPTPEDYSSFAVYMSGGNSMYLVSLPVQSV